LSGPYGGLDLTASPNRASAVTVIASSAITTGLYRTDDEILSALKGASIVAIDSPLSQPRHGWHRDVDRTLLRMGYKVFPAAWPSMKALYRRALVISSRLSEAGAKVIETHPLSALKSSRCSGYADLAEALGITIHEKPRVKDEVDSLIAAIVAMAYDEGLVMSVRASDGEVYLLKPICNRGL
jgi:predicted nuclease with RNAse H fold